MFDSHILDATPVVAEVCGTVVRGEKSGPSRIIQEYTQSEAGMRELLLPAFVTAMLTRRRLDATTALAFPSKVGALRSPGDFLTQWHGALKGTRFEGPSRSRSDLLLRPLSLTATTSSQRRGRSDTPVEHRTQLP